ncbi:membrane protein insertion efficiency factor YidD [Candidatus Peregrinibacteria bacterium]|nr:membrane protein insertion efficiency factor YidD [Candidatus Peregrinibacteria bacterium]
MFLVVGYQKTLSPDHGCLKRFFSHGYCKFSPSCSEYAKQSFEKHGLIWGLCKAFWRVCRCNPWSKGGEDRP